MDLAYTHRPWLPTGTRVTVVVRTSWSQGPGREVSQTPREEGWFLSARLRCGYGS